MTVNDGGSVQEPASWPWAPSKQARAQYDELTSHPAAPTPQDAVDAMIRRIIADPYEAGSTRSPNRPEWDRAAAEGSLVIPYQVHDPERNPQAKQRFVIILRIVWAD
ncbi:hypothetical protein ACIBBE_24620 [Streptomyces sp. NPDC051644]|uniref:hypothetical protein n=1 Tax=Streptomyces sp. NPDC051644 TaxID=3365666 RepID=UPI0037A209A3